MEYFEVPRPSGHGRCSDNACPCPEVTIPRGTGYLYISRELVDFRKDCRTYEELLIKLDRMAKSDDTVEKLGLAGLIRILPPGTSSPILMCEQGAKLRGLDLAIAAADAGHWWETGWVPLRPTPPSQAKDRAREARAQAQESRQREKVERQEPKEAHDKQDNRRNRWTIAETVTGQHLLKNVSAGEFAKVCLRIEPLHTGGGIEFVDETPVGSIPKRFMPAVERGVRNALENCMPGGGGVTGIRFTVYDGLAHPVDSSDVAFEVAAQRAAEDAIRHVVLHPIE